jgi:hypothetical protein
MLRHSTFYALWLPVPGLTLIGLGLGSRRSPRKKLSGLLLLSIGLASLVVLPACGGSGSSGGGGGGGGNPGTPAGTYTLTITAKDGNGVTQSSTASTVNVTVNSRVAMPHTAKGLLQWSPWESYDATILHFLVRYFFCLPDVDYRGLRTNG